MFQIDHLGIAVKSLAAAKDIYEKLGLAADRNFSDVIRAFIAESRGA